MRQLKNTSEANLTLYPMAGKFSEQFDNLLQTLKWLGERNPTPTDAREWLQRTFGISSNYALNIYSLILIGGGLVSVGNGRCYLTYGGQSILDSASLATLFRLFEERYVGISTFLEVLSICDKIDFQTFRTMWFEAVKAQFPRAQSWGETNSDYQCRHRLKWLRSMGLVTSERGRYALSKDGWKFILINMPDMSAIQHPEIIQQETQLNELVSEQFQLFDSSVQEERSFSKTVVRNSAFRKIVAAQYEHHCAVCGFRLKTPRGGYEVEAAHIIPKRKNGVDDPRNGIALCKTHHWAFDEGVISVCPSDLTVIVASYLEDQKSDVSVQQILQLRGSPIRSVLNEGYSPAVEALTWHNQHVFEG